MIDKKNNPKITDLTREGSTQFVYKSKREAAVLQRLAESLAAGDPRALEELYLLLFDSVSAFIYRIVRSQEEAHDIAQDLFVELWENISRIDSQKNIKSYIYTMAKSLFYRHLRNKLSAKGFTSMPDPVDVLTVDISPDDLFIADEWRLIVTIGLESMPRQRRQVFERSRYERLSSEEIALPVDVFKSRRANTE